MLSKSVCVSEVCNKEFQYFIFSETFFTEDNIRIILKGSDGELLQCNGELLAASDSELLAA